MVYEFGMLQFQYAYLHHHHGPVKYRHLQQVFSLRLGKFDGERLAVLGDAVGGVKQLAHCGDEGELGWFAAGDEAVIWLCY